MKNILLATTCLATVAACTQTKKVTTAQLPNIVIIYADDLGYGDAGVYGALARSGEEWRKNNRFSKLLPTEYERNLSLKYLTLPEALK